MRKFKFKQVQNYIELFKKIGEGIYVELNDKKGNVEKACEYLELCQQKAIDLGTYIENEEGEGHPTVSQLEAFCEVLYEVHEDVQSEHGLSADSAKNRINTCINRIENSAKTDIKITNLAVFLPYKASMWDSLESVWQAADEDPDCETYVIPIPYYDKTPQNKLGTVHWEGDLFPDYVPITRFDEFDFAAAHPDMIFIHNPYDYANLVTSVHPAFYSDKLKEFTDCLVYIPYFCTSGAMSEGFKLLPAYLNADYIIVQSEQLIDYYDPIIPREKILPLGSPKFDSVIRKCQNPPEPPAEWKAKMEGKKVYFLNMSLKAMLGNTVQFLQKLNYVLECFKDSDKACLLWRPHPLMESTFDSMRPEYKQAYIDMRDKYIAEDWGIYDTTPNIEDSIAWSDVYVGDGASSVVSMFGVAGKEILLLEYGITSLFRNDDYRSIFFQAISKTQYGPDLNKYCIILNKYLWFSPNNDMKYQYFCDIPGDETNGSYIRAVEFNNKIYLMPLYCQHIMVIDAISKAYRVIDLKKEEVKEAFASIHFYKNYAFFQPLKYSCLVRFNMKTEELDYVENYRDFNVIKNDIDGDMLNVRLAKGDMFYAFNTDGTKIMELNLETLEKNIFDSNINGIYWRTFAKSFDNDEKWLVPLEGTEIIKYNLKEKKGQKYNLSVPGLEGYDRALGKKSMMRLFSTGTFDGDRVIISPWWGNKFIELDCVTEKVNEWESPFECSEENKSIYIPNYGIGYFMQDEKDGRSLYCHEVEKKYFYVDLKTKEIQEYPQEFMGKERIKDSLRKGYVKRDGEIGYYFIESMYNSLLDNINEDEVDNNIFDAEKQKEEFIRINQSMDGNCGRTVLEKIK